MFLLPQLKSFSYKIITFPFCILLKYFFTPFFSYELFLFCQIHFFLFFFSPLASFDIFRLDKISSYVLGHGVIVLFICYFILFYFIFFSFWFWLSKQTSERFSENQFIFWDKFSHWLKRIHSHCFIFMLLFCF